MGTLEEQHCRAANHVYLHMCRDIDPTLITEPHTNGFMITLPNDYSLCVICPSSTPGNMTHELDGLLLAPIMNTRLIKGDGIDFNDEWGYNGPRTYATDHPEDIVNEYFRLVGLIESSI